MGSSRIAFLPKLSQVSLFHRTDVLEFFEFEARFFLGGHLLK